MNDDDYSYDCGMVGDSRPYRPKMKKTKLPHFRPIFKKQRRRGRRGTSTDSSDAIAGFLMGMVFVFPRLAALLMAYPGGYLLTVGGIGLVTWMFWKSWITALVVAGEFLAMALLGFVSLGLLAALLG